MNNQKGPLRTIFVSPAKESQRDAKIVKMKMLKTSIRSPAVLNVKLIQGLGYRLSCNAELD